MNREIHVRICESLGAKPPGRLDPIPFKINPVQPGASSIWTIGCSEPVSLDILFTINDHDFSCFF